MCIRDRSKEAVDTMLGLRLHHIGINTGNEEEAMKVATLLGLSLIHIFQAGAHLHLLDLVNGLAVAVQHTAHHLPGSLGDGLFLLGDAVRHLFSDGLHGLGHAIGEGCLLYTSRCV